MKTLLMAIIDLRSEWNVRRARNLNTDDRQTNNETIKLAGSRTNGRSKCNWHTMVQTRFAFSNYISTSRPIRCVWYTHPHFSTSKSASIFHEQDFFVEEKPRKEVYYSWKINVGKEEGEERAFLLWGCSRRGVNCFCWSHIVSPSSKRNFYFFNGGLKNFQKIIYFCQKWIITHETSWG